MKTNRRAFLKTAALALALLPSWAGHTTTSIARSESNATKRLTQKASTGGFSQARLARMHEAMAGHVASGRMPGLVTLVSRRGETHVDAIGMKDTGFSVPPAKVDRLATCYRTDFTTGKVVVFDEARGGRFTRPPVFEPGAGWSRRPMIFSPSAG